MRRVFVTASLLAAMALFACGRSPPDDSKQERAAATIAQPLGNGGAAGVLRESLSSKTAEMEEPVWLEEALNDPDPKVRMQALDYWSEHPGEKLDPVTNALVDPDERVRTHAEKLFEEALARK